MSKKRCGCFALAAPRGYAKSTIANFLYMIWSICYSKERFILILSATAKQAQKLLSNVSTSLETNRLLREDFPEVFDSKEKIKTKWTQDEIITPNNIDEDIKDSHGRDINDKDFGRTIPQEDAQDDDEDDSGRPPRDYPKIKMY